MHYYLLGTISVSWLLWLWKSYLNYRQYRVCKSTREVPDELRGTIDDETFKKAKVHSIVKSQFDFVSSTYHLVLFTLILWCYLMPKLWKLTNNLLFGDSESNKPDPLWEILQTLLFLFIVSLVWSLVNLPVYLCDKFCVEQNYQAKSYRSGLINLMWIFGISIGISIFRRLDDYTLLCAWLIFIYACELFLIFFDVQINASFNPLFASMPPGELRNKIEQLARDLSFPLTDVIVVKRPNEKRYLDTHQQGIFKRRYIVINEALIENHSPAVAVNKRSCTDDEIIALVCREIGHWHLDHTFILLAIKAIKNVLFFVLLSSLYDDSAQLYSAFGFDHYRPVVIRVVLFVIMLALYEVIFGIVVNTIISYIQHQADCYAKQRGQAESLKTALAKLNTSVETEFPVCDELYSIFNQKQLPYVKRIETLSVDSMV